MIFGYTRLDPLVVLAGTALAVWYVSRNPVKLLAYLPAALSLYFFIPWVTFMTLWQTVPLVLTGRVLVLGRIKVADFFWPLTAVIALGFLFSAIYAVLLGLDSSRAVIRVIYYLGIFALFFFCYEVGRKPEAMPLLLKGLVVIGLVYAVYGVYQIIATELGLPLRGILRGTRSANMAYEGGIVRVNSLANEPKRLGYVLFISALACLALTWREPENTNKLRWYAGFIMLISVFTFAGSYFLALTLFAVAVLVLYPSRATAYAVIAVVILGFLSILFPDLGILDAIQEGYERRAAEVEVGLDGQVVYRQEFYAWDYLAENPSAAIFGVGLGQYFVTLFQTYGLGIGFGNNNRLLPLNSLFLEMVFDLGGVVTVLFYAGMAALIWRLRQAQEHFLCLALMFLVLQSLTILTSHFLVMIAGVACARISLHKEQQRRPVGQSSGFTDP